MKKTIFDPQTESQEYLRKVVEAIKTGKISPDEAISACTGGLLDASECLSEDLPFFNGTVAGVVGKDHVRKIGGSVIDTQTFIAPSISIFKGDSKDMRESEENPEASVEKIDKIFDLDEHPKLFRIIDSVGAKKLSTEEQELYKNDSNSFIEKQEFHMLDWSLHGYSTPVDKVPGVIRERPGRLKTWKQINDAIEGIAVATMKDRGMNF